MSDYQQIYEQWKNDPYFDEADRAGLLQITDPKEIEDRFYKDLEFGTGGMRGVVGFGCNRMNKYNIRRASAAFASFLKSKFGSEACTKGVAVAWDSRLNSKDFAKQTALVFAGAGIKAYLFDFVSATPLLSFAVRRLGCCGGVVITASHNTKEYNGYKAYDRNGCQLLIEDADAVVANYVSTDIHNVVIADEADAAKDGLLVMLGSDMLTAFEDAVCMQAHELDSKAKESIRIVYTPLNGAGNVPVRDILKKQGYTQVSIVKEQEQPDGNFPTLRSPNPEERDALTLAIAQAQSEDADLVLGTDPDSDRVGIAVKDGSEYRLFSGNQTGALLLNYLIERRRDMLSGKSTVITTIVTGQMGIDIARRNGLSVIEVLTGFKFIGDKMTLYKETGSNDFLFGYEESYGYLTGDHARDKDAVVAAMLIAEMAAYYKASGRTLADVLNGLYSEYGYYFDTVISYTLKGKEGAMAIKNITARLRNTGAALMDGITSVEDYSQGIGDLPKSDVLKFRFKDGSWLAARPSGTEPKIKFYYSLKGKNKQETDSIFNARKEIIDKIVEEEQK